MVNNTMLRDHDDNSATWLSVVIPVYNVLPYLRECVESVMKQAQPGTGVEVLMYNDASTDGSDRLAGQLVQEWPNQLKFLSGVKNVGLSVARNTLAKEAKGRYLWFLDSDDKLLPEAIESLNRIVESERPDLILCDFRVWRSRSQLKHRLRGEQHQRTFEGPQRQLCRDKKALLAGLLRRGRMHAWSKISRRELWHAGPARAELNFPAGRYFEDLATIPLLALRTDSFYYEPMPWVAYRQRGDSILATPSCEKALDQSASLREFAAALKATPYASDAAVQAALVRQAERNLVGAMRQLQGEHQTNTTDVLQLGRLAEQIRDDFVAISPLTATQLSNWHLRHGHWLRRARFCRWFYWTPSGSTALL